MRTTTTVLCVLVGLAAMSLPANVRAQSLPAVEITSSYSTYAAEFSLGWRFIPTRPFRVTALGLIDAANDGVQDLDLQGGQQVRLFTWGSGYLREAVIPANAMPPLEPELAGQVNAYYMAIDPIVLYPGTEYMVAARVSAARDYAYSVTFLNEEIKPFTRTFGQATKVGYPAMPDTATDTGAGYPTDTFPIGPTNPASYYGGTFKYELLPLIPGDANYDQKVNEADAAIVAEHWGQAGGWGDGDFNDDDVVGPADAAIQVANWYYGMTEGAAPLGVPEPSALALLTAVAAGLLTIRRGRE